MEICLIVPCYNEAGRLDVPAFLRLLQQVPQVSFCFVNDGSQDDTSNILQHLATNSPRVTAINLPKNGGKAEAVRQGMLAMKTKGYAYLGYWDADLATPFEEIPAFLRALKDTGADLVMGCRFLRLGANVKRTWYRHFLGRAFATVASLVLGLPTYDTQCGAKIFSPALYLTVFDRPFVSHWIFDVELLMRVKQTPCYRSRPNCLYELPLHYWHDRSGSKLKLKDFLKAPWELWQIYWTYRGGHGH